MSVMVRTGPGLDDMFLVEMNIEDFIESIKKESIGFEARKYSSPGSPMVFVMTQAIKIFWEART